jgi:pimeloyl-ACP methyl ester carboxylesterase
MKLDRMSRSEVRYARSGEINIAYQVTGDGPFDLILVPGFISRLELDWAEPRHARFLDRLGAFARLIRFDKRGHRLVRSTVGAWRDRDPDDVRAVMDAVGCARAALVAYWEGGPMAALFAATYPERTSALALYGTFARRTRSADYPWHPTREEMIRGADLIVEGWGTERTTALDAFSPGADAALRRWWIERERAGASPGAIGQLIRSNLDIDVRPALRSIQAATLVLQPESNSAEGEYIASLIPGARFATTPGESGLPWLAPEVADEIEEFLTGVRPTPVKDRVLATIVFTDLVGSTERARELGDRAWSQLLDGHHAEVRRQLERFRGEEIDTAGDGFMALFDGPARAIRVRGPGPPGAQGDSGALETLFRHELTNASPARRCFRSRRTTRVGRTFGDRVLLGPPGFLLANPSEGRGGEPNAAALPIVLVRGSGYASSFRSPRCSCGQVCWTCERGRWRRPPEVEFGARLLDRHARFVAYAPDHIEQPPDRQSEPRKDRQETKENHTEDERSGVIFPVAFHVRDCLAEYPAGTPDDDSAPKEQDRSPGLAPPAKVGPDANRDGADHDRCSNERNAREHQPDQKHGTRVEP